MLYQNLVRRMLFAASAGDPERAHEWAMMVLRGIGACPPVRYWVRSQCFVTTPRLRQTLCGLEFSNPVGLAAGFDKNAKALLGLSALGFGHIEVGTVTPEPQTGNPRPRLFRLPVEQSLINRMGFNNDGAYAVTKRLWEVKPKLSVPIGVSLGKGKDTLLMNAVGDYNAVLASVYLYGDYFVVNVSSPNTADLRELQRRSYLKELLSSLQAQLSGRFLRSGHENPKPLFVKIDPDLDYALLDDIIEVCSEQRVAGIIAANTSVKRDQIREQLHSDEKGGLSGPPLRQRALQLIKYIRAGVPTSMIIIGSGGVSSGADVYAMLQMGANLVQIWTSFVYQGPRVVRKINRELLQLMDQDGLSHILETRQMWPV